jgi:predicted phosphodiesterase
VTLLHGNQVLNTVYVDEERADSFLEKMGSTVGVRAGDIICFGHTHKPWHRIVSGIHFVNTGSVGRPKDGDWRASYVLLEAGAGEPRVTLVRIEYAVERAARAILESDLPDDFADYLRTGGKTTAGVNN